MPNGEKWGGIPVKATPKLKAILYSIQSLALLDGKEKPESWDKWCEEANDNYGHMIGTKGSALMLLGLDRTLEQQERRIL